MLQNITSLNCIEYGFFVSQDLYQKETKHKIKTLLSSYVAQK